MVYLTNYTNIKGKAENKGY